MQTSDNLSSAAAFDRSNGLIPAKEVGDVVASLNALGRAAFASYMKYIQNVRDNAPETEREIVRLHLSFLNTCSDLVKNRLEDLDRTNMSASPASSGLEASRQPVGITID